MKERLYLFDTTLRDGQQTPGIDFSLEDKILVAKMLDELGIDYVEGGYPGANPTDTAFFARKRTSRAAFTAFGMVKRAGRSVVERSRPAGSPRREADAICFVAKTWDFHVRLALGCSNEENLESIAQSVAAAVAAGREALLDCEHFFDGYKANPDYALACVEAALDAGARWVVLCDTNGGTLPDEVEAIVGAVVARFPRRADRHPCAQRHRPGGGEFARRGARRRAADPGHAERHRRALRQRRSHRHHPDAAAEARLRRALRDRHFAGRAAEPRRRSRTPSTRS